MTTRSIGPSLVLLTRENPYIRLSETGNGPVTTDASFWRILFSPGGPGHVLFLQSELSDNQPRIYTDNIAMTGWLQQEIQGTINPTFGDLDLAEVESRFASSGDLRTSWTETVTAKDEVIALTWESLGESFLSHRFPVSNPDRPRGVFTVLIPANVAKVIINGKTASGRPFPRQRDSREPSTCALPFSESWLLPY